MSKFERHIGKGEPIEIDGEEFILKPLTTEYIPDFFKAMKSFSGDEKDPLKNMDEDSLRSIQKIIDSTLERSYPDEPEEARKVFGMKYMTLLLPKIIEINSAEIKEDEALKKVRTLEKVNEKSN